MALPDHGNNVAAISLPTKLFSRGTACKRAVGHFERCGPVEERSRAPPHEAGSVRRRFTLLNGSFRRWRTFETG